MDKRRDTEPWTSARADKRETSEDVEITLSRDRPAAREDDASGDPLLGLLIDGRYRIEGCIGVGGMSRVYSGIHTMTGAPVAIKMIDPELSRVPATKQRLLGEARAMMTLQSNHIVRALDVGALPSGQLYVVMEYLDGVDLDTLLNQEGPLPWPRVAAIALQICNGLATAHRRDIIHRDIKPQNCFRVMVDDNPEHIKIIDFGVAKEIKVDVGPTQQGFLIGTPEYTAPELVQRGAKPDARADIYSLGVTLYKLLTGRAPFHGASPIETLRRHVEEPPVPPSKAARAVPREADEIVLRALEKDPARRFGSAEEMARSIKAALGISTAGTLIPSTELSTSRAPAIAEEARNTIAPPRSPHLATPPPSPRSALGRPATSASLATVPPPVRDVPRPIDGRMMLLRLASLASSSALFIIGTWLIQPRAAPPAPTTPALIAAEEPTAQQAPLAEETPPTPAEALDNPSVAPVGPESTAALQDDALPLEPRTLSTDDPTKTLPPNPDSPGTNPDPAGTNSDPDPTGTKPLTPTEPAAEGAPTDPNTPPERPSDTTGPQPEPDFPYKQARRLIEEQHDFLRKTCLKKAQEPTTRLKFRIDVRSTGRATIRVFSPDPPVRKCVRELYVFPFPSSSRGAAFEYTVTGTGGALKPVPMEPELR